MENKAKIKRRWNEVKERNVKVSVIVPAYNEQKYLARCLDTVVNQTLDEIEIIIVDDGSTDDTYNICENYKERYPSFVQVVHKQNEGLGPARNTGLEYAHGEYIGFVDADDWIELNMYQEMYETAKKNDADVIVCDVKKIFVSENRESVEVSLPEESSSIDIGQYIKDGLNPAYSWNKLYKREIWSKYKFKKMVYEDLDIVLTILSNCKRVSYIQKPFNTYYKRPNSITTSYYNIRLLDIMTAYKDAVNDANSLYKKEIEFCVAKRILINLKTEGLLVYKAEFMELIKELLPNFVSNDYIKEDPVVKNIIRLGETEVLPRRIYYLPVNGTLQNMSQYTRNYEYIEMDTSQELDMPDEYYRVKEVYEHGGISIDKGYKLVKPIGLYRTSNRFICFGQEDNVNMFGAQKGDRILKEVLDSYADNRTLSLSKRMKMVLEQNGFKDEIKQEMIMI